MSDVKAAHYSDQKNWSDTYLTDPALVTALGPFSVDPCCPPEMPWATARRMLNRGAADGLTDDWGRGRAWMNPPYRGVTGWAERFVAHGNGICLLNGRSMETKATQLVLASCSGVFFPAGRLTWYDAAGAVKTSTKGHVQKWFGSVLIGMMSSDAVLLSRLPRRGFPGVFLKGPNA